MRGTVSTPALRLLAVATVFIGLAFRALPLLRFPGLPLHTCDGRAFYSLALSLAQGNGLNIDDPIVVQACLGYQELGPSHLFAPALSFIEAGFVIVLGDTQLALVVPLLLLSWGAVVVTWWATRDLFGSDAGLLVAAAVAIDWVGISYGTWLGYSENLVLIAFTLTLWAVLRALHDDRYLVLAGIFAGLGYLSKAAIGWFFLLIGFGGLAWRLLFRGRGVLRNRWYLAAIAVFAVPVVVWSLRNISLFWDGSLPDLMNAWQTSAIQARLVATAFETPGLLLVGLAGQLPILLFGLIPPVVPFLGDLSASLRQLKDEQTAGLWLAVALIFALAWFFAGAFWVTEQTNLLWMDRIRYLVPAQVPLLWLLVGAPKPASTARWLLAYLIRVATFGIFVLLAADPIFAR